MAAFGSTGFSGGYIYYWQGTPSSWECGGDAFYLFEFQEFVFDTGNGTYPSTAGKHNGTITPSCNISVSKLYTYPCAGTGGHTEYVKIWRGSEAIAEKTWNGYLGDWYNISFNRTFILYKNETYNYTICTGSYPQIIHEQTKDVEGVTITCTSFEDANGKVHTDWIPAIKLY
ncbi:MAG TPA: hypothetical protein VMW40_00600 [Candidatus Bathyarchaeia archaeon]|nr:hypothetical protein [Candidatus Bathyarchaeia archaeon]